MDTIHHHVISVVNSPLKEIPFGTRLHQHIFFLCPLHSALRSIVPTNL